MPEHAEPPVPAAGVTAAVAVLASQMGELKHALDSSLRQVHEELAAHGQRISDLEEQHIRADERERTRAELTAEHATEAREGVSVSLTRRQMLLSVLMLLVMFAGVVVAAVEALHHA